MISDFPLVHMQHVFGCLFRKVKIIVEPLPGINLIDIKTRATVCEGSKVEETANDNGENGASSSPGANKALSAESFSDGPAAVLLVLFLGDAATALGNLVNRGRLNVEDKFDKSACHEGRSEMSGEVVVKEELTAHDEEGDVVSCPGEEEETGAVVETRASAWESVSLEFKRKKRVKNK